MPCRSHVGLYCKYGFMYNSQLNIGMQADRWPLMGALGPWVGSRAGDLALFDPLPSLAPCLPSIRRRRALFLLSYARNVYVCVVTVLGEGWETLRMVP